jgi:hypothetical protein
MIRAAFPNGLPHTFFPTVNQITFGHAGSCHDADTGWRKPISISGQGKAASASYSAGGLVFCAESIGQQRPSTPLGGYQTRRFDPKD